MPPDDPYLPRYLEALKALLGREADPLKALEVEEINGAPATESPYLPTLEALFSLTREARGVRLRKRYGRIEEPEPMSSNNQPDRLDGSPEP